MFDIWQSALSISKSIKTTGTLKDIELGMPDSNFIKIGAHLLWFWFRDICDDNFYTDVIAHSKLPWPLPWKHITSVREIKENGTKIPYFAHIGGILEGELQERVALLPLLHEPHSGWDESRVVVQRAQMRPGQRKKRVTKRQQHLKLRIGQCPANDDVS